MKPLRKHRACARGFTLAELAIVIVIVTLLLGGLAVPLLTRMEQRNVQRTRTDLEEIKEALIGFAILNGRLPSPAGSASNGAESGACATHAACTGFVPWVTLGTPKLDAWGKIYRYSVTPGFTSTFTLTTTASKTVRTRDTTGALINLATQLPAVILSYGRQGYGHDEAGSALPDRAQANADEDSNSTATQDFLSRTVTENSAVSGGAFDDQVLWVPASVLFNRLVSAGRLP